MQTSNETTDLADLIETLKNALYHETNNLTIEAFGVGA